MPRIGVDTKRKTRGLTAALSLTVAMIDAASPSS